jgi:hypothetical protein
MSDFSKLLQKTMAEVQPPAVPPQGTWRPSIKGGAKFKERKAGGSDNAPMADAVIPLSFVQPLEDVHPTDLEKFGDFTKETAFHRIPIFTEKDFWNVKRFYLTAGFSEEDVNARTSETLLELKGGQVVAYIKHRQNPEDPERPFVDVTNIVSA